MCLNYLIFPWKCSNELEYADELGVEIDLLPSFRRLNVMCTRFGYFVRYLLRAEMEGVLEAVRRLLAYTRMLQRDVAREALLKYVL